MQFLLPVFLLAATAVIGTLQQSSCDGTVPEMHRFLYLRPQKYVRGQGNVALKTREECSLLCERNDRCVWAYYFDFNCYPSNLLVQSDFTRWLPGETYFKIFRTSTSCNQTFPQIMSGPNLFKLPSMNTTGGYKFMLNNYQLFMLYNKAFTW